MDKRHSKIIILACLVISAIAVSYILWSRKTVPQAQNVSHPPPVALASPGTSVEAPDGLFTLTMKTQKGQGENTYTFLMKNETDGVQSQVFTQNLPTGSIMSIPLNTFSPDDKYIFLKQSDPNGFSFIALTSTGKQINGSAQTLNFSSLFAAKYPNYVLTDATGWGGMNLIVFNTNKLDGSQGPSFWFEVPQGTFIPLSTRFN